MAYDLAVGTGRKVRDSPDFVGAIEFNELAALSRLLKHGDSFFLERISNLFEDQSFSLGEVEQALAHLLPLLCVSLHPDERALLHKLIAVLSFASWKQEGLHGIAD
jgi:hypothetical protein